MINQRLSLVIPRVFPQWVDEAKIIKIFRDQKLGEIFKVNIVRMPDEKGRNHPIYKAYLYFSVWFENIITQNFQDRIYGEHKQARVVYDDPWFWTVFKNTERVKLSNADKRMMRISLETYKEDERLTRTIREMKKNRDFLEEQQEQLAYELAEQKQQLAEQKQQLAEQNNAIQLLQDFCIKSGLEVPFWSAKHPPSAEVSSLEALSAATAVACADFVLQDNSEAYNEEDQHMAYNSIPYECVDSVLFEETCEADTCEADTCEADTYKLDQEFGEIFNYDFIPVNSYEAEWVTENPYTNNSPEQSRLCSYLGGGFQMDEMTSMPLYM
jgi:hypothetical protein